MRKWAFLFAAAAVAVIGCSGGGSSSGTTGTPPTTGGLGRATVALPAIPGRIEVAYITGQGRAVGSVTAVIRRQYFEDEVGFIEQPLTPERHIGLDSYTYQTVGVNVPIAGRDSRFFDLFNLEILKLRVELANGGYREVTGQGGAPVLHEAFAACIRVFPARDTILPVFLDDAMLNVSGNDVIFDRSLFELINYDPNEGKMVSFISDYVAFDLSAMSPADRPTMLTSGAPANRAYFSGDGQALSADPSEGVFEVLTPEGHLEGLFSGPTQLTNFGTYTLLQGDPRDLNEIAKITSLLGRYRNYTQVLNNIGSFEFMTFPNSHDDNLQDLVMFQRNAAGSIVSLYFGFIDYSTGDFSAWPIRNIDDGSVDNEITGNVTNLVDAVGQPTTEFPRIRGGRFTINPGIDVPSSFPLTGNFLVFRR